MQAALLPVWETAAVALLLLGDMQGSGGAAKVGTVSLLSLNAGGLRPQFLPALVLSLRWKPHTELPLACRWYDDIPGRGCWVPSPLEGQSESKTFQ